MSDRIEQTETLMISPLRYASSFWRRILLFQSLDQFASYLLIVGLVLIGIASLIYFLGGQPHYEVSAGALAGGMIAVWLVQPCSFFIRGHQYRSVLFAVEKRLKKYGYVEEKFMNDAVVIYRHKLPRWLTWKENDVRISSNSDTVKVYGPRYILKSLHKAITNRSSGHYS